MFSKALFKQSCKANGIMWAVITIAVCIMLACLMTISGSGSIGAMKVGITDTMIESSIDSEIEKRAINYYTTAADGLEHFDETMVSSAAGGAIYYYQYTNWLNQGMTTEEPIPTNVGGMAYKSLIDGVKEIMPLPNREDYNSDEDFKSAISQWQAMLPSATSETAMTAYYMASINELQEYMNAKAKNLGYAEGSNEALELIGIVMYTLNPGGQFDEFYTELGETAPSYDLTSITSDTRSEYINNYVKTNVVVFLAGNMISEETTEKMLEQIASYNLTYDDYKNLSYEITVDGKIEEVSRYTGVTGYSFIKDLATDTIITFEARLDYEFSLIDTSGLTDEEIEQKQQEVISSLTADITRNFLTDLPADVSMSLQEIGQIDLFALIVGTIFYKMAGLLLPIIYIIMTANNLIAGQVDSGSMAYILSTSTKRNQVVFTQAVYLVGSLFAMCVMTTITSMVCLFFVQGEGVTLDYADLALLNLGMFITLFAMSGISFLASCWFNRSKHSMSLGGGLNMFFLVATMLGLFGSEVLPSIVRLDSLNFFNFCTIISFFDDMSMIAGTAEFIYKLAILCVIGVVCYIVGAFKFNKKDLPL